MARGCKLHTPSVLTGIIRRIRQCLFLTLLGTTSLESLIQTGKNDRTEWNELKMRLTERTANINVISSLGVGACATFLNTTSPTDVADWTHEFPYVCIGAAMWCSLLAVVNDLGLLIFLNVMSTEHLESAQRSRFKRVLLLTLLMMPLTFLSAAGICAGVAWLGAAWFGDVLWIKLAMAVGSLAFFIALFVIVAVIY